MNRRRQGRGGINDGCIKRKYRERRYGGAVEEESNEWMNEERQESGR